MAKSGGETIIAHGVKIVGNFVSDGNVIIEGEVEGTIEAAGDLKVGDEARLKADVTVSNATVAGSIDGTLRVSEKCDLLASSKMSGELSARILSVAPGSQVNGTVRMGDAAAAKNGKGKRSSASEIETE